MNIIKREVEARETRESTRIKPQDLLHTVILYNVQE